MPAAKLESEYVVALIIFHETNPVVKYVLVALWIVKVALVAVLAQFKVTAAVVGV